MQILLYPTHFSPSRNTGGACGFIASIVPHSALLPFTRAGGLHRKHCTAQPVWKACVQGFAFRLRAGYPPSAPQGERWCRVKEKDLS